MWKLIIFSSKFIPIFIILSIIGKECLGEKLQLNNIAKLNLNGVTDLEVTINHNTLFTLPEPWFIIKGKKCTFSNKCFQLKSTTHPYGEDAWGFWNSSEFLLKSDNDYYFSVYIKKYPNINAFVFGQTYYNDTPGTSNNDLEKTGSSFPSISTNSTIELGYYAVRGYMYGDDDKVFGRWGPNMDLKNGHKIGPIILFDKQLKTTLIVSHHSSFMGQSTWFDGQTVNFGIGGRISQVPKGYRASTMLFYTEDSTGIRNTILKWGKLMKSWYNSKNDIFSQTDLTNNYLGYYTDDGACYYYYTEPKKTYEQTLIDVVNYAKKEKIPYRFIQLDSWFYPKYPDNAGGGTVDWIPHKNYFPNGLQHFQNSTRLPVICHGKWWSTKTPLAKQNGGPFNFIFQEKKNMALPIDSEFWDFILKRARGWGLIKFEQDWLGQMFDWMDILQTNITVGEIFMRQLADGARRNGQVVHLATAYPRHAMAGLQFDVATEGRVSEDYALQKYQWRIGITSIFSFAVGQRPSKDTLFTSPKQNCPHYSHLVELASDLNVAVTVLSSGIVGTGDQIGATNRTVLMKCCNEDGLVLKPDRPSMAIDAMMAEIAFKQNIGPDAEFTSTFSMISKFFFGIILVADLKHPYDINPSILGFKNKFPKSKIYSYNNYSNPVLFSDSSNFAIKNCTKIDFCVYYTTPIFTINNSEVLFLGELTKWVPMSSKRFENLIVSNHNILLTVRGAAFEEVHLTFMEKGKIFTIICKLDISGYALFNLLQHSC